jgi:pyridoxamine-phosphate oxidase
MRPITHQLRALTFPSTRWQSTLSFLQQRMDVHNPDKLRVTSHHQYHTPEHLTPTDVYRSPLEQFKEWFRFANDHNVPEPEAMSIATVSKSGIPSCRTVLLKEVDENGFVFFTNYNSRKSQELTENPNAALNFYWRGISRQVRVVGRVEKVSERISTEYFSSRPVGSKIGAWASPQSKPVSEGEVQARYVEFEKRFVDGKDSDQEDIPRPEYWGGWRVIPS